MEILIFDHMSECTESEVQRMLPMVSAQRREQALRYKHTHGKYCCLKSWLMLKELIDKRQQTISDFKYYEHGKPFMESGPYFSISHCKEGIAVAVDDTPIGIDIEGIRHADKELIARTMNKEEQEGMDERKFIRLWTQKEAIVKAEGVGIVSFEQLREIRCQNSEFRIQTIEKEKYIYSIAHK